MSATTFTGLLLIAMPVAFNALFALLAARFEYPDILRKPTTEVLAAFRAGGTPILLAVATTVGVLAAAVQFLGLIRWPFLVPYLARAAAEPDASPARLEAVDVVFQSFNRYLGVAVGEHLGYLLTGTWTLLMGVALTQTTVGLSTCSTPRARARPRSQAKEPGCRNALEEGIRRGRVPRVH